ncbi:IclR family transcriptional regulator domain-containing protein [Halomonas alimentaria]|uniref:IclR family transcriptional regulator domain-containing protein n=1 Tax=Halomonas alimentaria TaxID=147248 RepID=UPI00248F9F96|nr:IclR family transcriptional regulator C-terminal domain-containing protein [Halomonas alimentaria]
MSVKQISALQRGLLVLEAVNEHGPIGLTALKEITGFPKASVLRILETLRHQGYIHFDEADKEYVISARSLALSNNFSFEMHSLRVVKPVVEKLRDSLGWPSDVAIYQHDKMVIADTNRRPGMLSANRTVGSRVPMLVSATGRAYLAAIKAVERAQIIERLKEATDPYEQAAKDAALVERIVRETQARGYALSNQEYMAGNIGAAVPIVHGQSVICVINLIALAKVSSLEEVENESVPLLLEAKAEIEKRLDN